MYQPEWGGEGGIGEEWIHVCVWLSSLPYSPETITTLLIAYTQHKIQVFK